jgi:hypothetical protein
MYPALNPVKNGLVHKSPNGHPNLIRYFNLLSNGPGSVQSLNSKGANSRRLRRQERNS